MKKYHAPAGATSIGICGSSFDVGADGMVSVPDEASHADLVAHGYRSESDVDPVLPPAQAAVVRDMSDAAAELEQRSADLDARAAALVARADAIDARESKVTCREADVDHRAAALDEASRKLDQLGGALDARDATAVLTAPPPPPPLPVPGGRKKGGK